MNCYSRNFSTRNKGWQEWKNYKARLNKKNKTIKIYVEKLKLIYKNESQATVSYVQQYDSDSLSDYGLKKVLLQKERGSWKIYGEEWQPLPLSANDQGSF